MRSEGDVGAIRRRNFLFSQLALGGSLLAGPAVLLGSQEQREPSGLTVEDAEQRLDKFFTVSRNLLSPLPLDTRLDRRVAVRLLTILNRKFDDFKSQLDQLSENPDATQRQSQGAQRIVAAWYTGVIDGKLVTYERALMYRLVADVLPVRTYCTGKPGDWASAPQPRYGEV
ncbi:sorbitol dehydrogenase family protein [Microbulbifer aggregans]|uniref:sorbitol dehydrogenase family protein n=1 Tax=Microbulbifer aggregans TaxID=1769779 RepID=UPI001CFC6E4A|nr:sorbitol dehydrogenase family protein [Microbulbifer aggregans]